MGPDRPPVPPRPLSLGTRPHGEQRIARPESRLGPWALPPARRPPGRFRAGHRAERRAPRRGVPDRLPPLRRRPGATASRAGLAPLRGDRPAGRDPRAARAGARRDRRAPRGRDGREGAPRQRPHRPARRRPDRRRAPLRRGARSSHGRRGRPQGDRRGGWGDLFDAPAHRLDRHGHLSRPRPRRRLAPPGGHRRARSGAAPGPQSHRRPRAGRLIHEPGERPTFKSEGSPSRDGSASRMGPTRARRGAEGLRGDVVPSRGYNRAMNVIVVVCNSLHLGFLGPYGNGWIETPHFGRLAAEGVVFDHHFPENLTTLPTRRSWWTGRYGFADADACWTPLRSDERILPDLLWDKGV